MTDELKAGMCAVCGNLNKYDPESGVCRECQNVDEPIIKPQQAEREAFYSWWNTADHKLAMDTFGLEERHAWIVWQARAKLDRTHTTGWDGDE